MREALAAALLIFSMFALVALTARAVASGKGSFRKFYVCECGWFCAPSFGDPYFLPDVCPRCGTRSGTHLVVARTVTPFFGHTSIEEAGDDE